jgi:two-component system OmpR family response regulator
MPDKDNIRNILVVDDEENIREFLKAFLEENHFKVSLAGDGQKALESIEENLPDLMITDLLLPGEHGIPLIKTVKEKYFIPTIIISSIYERDQVEDFMEEYFVEAFFEKPLNLDLLLEKINSILDDRTV